MGCPGHPSRTGHEEAAGGHRRGCGRGRAPVVTVMKSWPGYCSCPFLDVNMTSQLGGWRSDGCTSRGTPRARGSRDALKHTSLGCFSACLFRVVICTMQQVLPSTLLFSSSVMECHLARGSVGERSLQVDMFRVLAWAARRLSGGGGGYL